jgi:hypothetical protein
MFTLSNLYGHACIVGLDRHFTAAPINKNRELDALRPAKIHDRIKCRPDSSTGKENVVNQNDSHFFHGEVDIGLSDHGILGGKTPIVAIESDIECGSGQGHPLPGLDDLPEAIRQEDSTRVDANDGKFVRTVIALQNLQGDARQ